MIYKDYYEQGTKYLKDKNQANKFCPRLSILPLKIPKDNLLKLYHKPIFKPRIILFVKMQIYHTPWKTFKKHSNIWIWKQKNIKIVSSRNNHQIYLVNTISDHALYHSYLIPYLNI